MVRRWVCPLCSDGVHAPDRPRRDDARRFCLKCSAKTGRLVERTCPAHDTAERRQAEAQQAARARRAQARAERTAQRRALRAEHHAAARAAENALKSIPITQLASMVGPRPFMEMARRWCTLAAWERDLSHVGFNLRFSASKDHTSGRAEGTRVTITVGTDLADAYITILHELAHVAAGRLDAGHGPRWRSFFMQAVNEVVGRRVEIPAGADRRELDRLLGFALAQHLFSTKGAQ